MPTKRTGPEPEDGAGLRDDHLPADPARRNPISRTRILADGSIARHPTLLKALEWLGANNPGGSTDP
jgi:hypothetical protein